MPKPVEAPQDDLASNEMLRVGEVAQLLQVHPNTVRYYGRIGELPELRVGRRGDRRYRRADVESFLQVRQLVASARTRQPQAAEDEEATRVRTVPSRIRLVATAGDRIQRQAEAQQHLADQVLRFDRQVRALAGLGQLPSLAETTFSQFKLPEPYLPVLLDAQRLQMPHLVDRLNALPAYKGPDLSELLRNASLPFQLENLAEHLASMPDVHLSPQILDALGSSPGHLPSHVLDLLTGKGPLTPQFDALKAVSAVHEQFTARMDLVASRTTLPYADYLAAGLVPEQSAIALLAKAVLEQSVAHMAAFEMTRLNVTAYDELSARLFTRADHLRGLTQSVALAAFEAGGQYLDAALLPAREFPNLPGLVEALPVPGPGFDPTIFEQLGNITITHGGEWARWPRQRVRAELQSLLLTKISRLGRRVNELYVDACHNAQQAGLELPFTPSVDVIDVAGRLSTEVVSDRQAFATFALGLFTFLIEASGDGNRLKRLVSNDHPTIGMLHTLRHAYAHDPYSRGNDKGDRQRQAVGRVFEQLVGSPVIASAEGWQRAQVALLEQVTNLLVDLNQGLASA